MEKARKLKKEEIAQLQRGEVVWKETHTEFDCGKYGQVNGYMIYPMLVSVPGKNGILGYIDNDSELIIKINNILENDYFWNKNPEPEQLVSGIPLGEALEIFDKYEAEKCSMQ